MVLPNAWRIARQSTIPLAVYALSRVIDTVILLSLRSQDHFLPDPTGTGATTSQPHSYAHLITNWDGVWFRTIAEQWYPSHLPTAPDGSVAVNAWAFYPGFPTLCRGLMHLGLPYAVSASVISIAAGAVGCCVLYTLIRSTGSRFTATMAVVGFSFCPTAVILQAAYSESLAFALLMAALLTLHRRRYGLFGVCAIALSLTRPVALPLVAVIGIHILIRWLRRRTEAYPVREQVSSVLAFAVTLSSFALWPFIAAVVTGRSDAYLATQHAWASGSLWSTWLGQAITLESGMAVALTVIAVSAAALIAGQRSARAWPSELRVWTVAYVLYVIASTRLTSSVTRYLMLAVLPWWPLPSITERREPRAFQIGLIGLLVCVGTLTQYVWTRTHLVLDLPGRSYP